jgi:hypothetical protein
MLLALKKVFSGLFRNGRERKTTRRERAWPPAEKQNVFVSM